jgi:Protein of unknown function (DUF2786)
MGKASRQRRLKKERERQRQRTPGSTASGGPGAKSQAGPEYVPSQRELAAAAIIDAVEAVRTGQQDSHGTYLDLLAVEHTPGWTGEVSRSLVEYLKARVTAAWQRGWQPAELARHVGREAGAAQAAMISDMIVAEMAQYAAATVDARWAAQVAVLEAAAPDKGAWWGSDSNYLAAWYGLGREPEFIGVVSVAVQTLHVFLRLPPVERLLPLPGTARVTPPPPARPAGAEPADERMLSRIRALLAKAEATEFAEEAEALSARAQQLMAKYSIDHALLAAEAGQEEAAGGRRIAVDNPYEAAKATLLQTVAAANRCRVVWSKELGQVTVIGFPADLDAVELLFTSLLVQASTAMLRAGGKRDEYGRSRTRTFRQSFLVSYAVRIGERLAEAAGQAEEEAVAEQRAARTESAAGGGAGATRGTDLVPFLAAREQAVDDAVDEMFGPLTRSRSVRARDAEGWASGRAAADLATLHNRAPVASS